MYQGIYNHQVDLRRSVPSQPISAFPENRELSRCQLYCHRWHRMLSLWQPTVPPETTKLALWKFLLQHCHGLRYSDSVHTPHSVFLSIAHAQTPEYDRYIDKHPIIIVIKHRTYHFVAVFWYFSPYHLLPWIESFTFTNSPHSLLRFPLRVFDLEIRMYRF